MKISLLLGIQATSAPRASFEEQQEFDSMTKALIFDFFGTLVDCLPGTGGLSYERSFQQAQRHGATASYEDFTRAWDEAFEILNAESSEALTEFHMRDVARVVAEKLDFQASSENLEKLGASFIEEWNNLPWKHLNGA